MSEASSETSCLISRSHSFRNSSSRYLLSSTIEFVMDTGFELLYFDFELNLCEFEEGEFKLSSYFVLRPDSRAKLPERSFYCLERTLYGSSTSFLFEECLGVSLNRVFECFKFYQSCFCSSVSQQSIHFGTFLN